MSLMMTKIRQERINVYWEPFATSTPLKRVPNNLKINDEPQKQMQKSTECLNVLLKKGYNLSNVIQNKETTETRSRGSKKSVKPKSPFYCDLTSSSDEDDSKENNKRPIIKINSVNVVKKKSLLKDEECEKEEEVLSKKIDNLKNKSINSHVRKTTTQNRSKSRCSQVELKHSKRTQNRTVSASLQKLDVENRNVVHDENVKNIKKVTTKSECKKNKSVGSSSQGLASASSPAKGTLTTVNENMKESTNGDQAITDSSDGKDTKERTFEKLNSKLPKSSQLKREGTKVLIVTPIKKIRTKSKENDKEQPILGSIENKKLSLVWEKEKNLSHQLFSDSVEQELINNLDLSTVDVKEASLHSLSQNQRKSIISKGSKSKPKTNQVTEVKKERPSRRRKAPKEFWLPENESDELKQSDEKKPKKQAKILNAASKNYERKQKTRVEEKVRVPNGANEELKMAEVPKEESVTHQTSENNIMEAEKEKDKRDPDTCKEKPTATAIAAEKGKRGKEEKESKRHNVDQSSFPVFKQLHEVPYPEGAHSGCFTSECWSIKNFKCGVFTLKTGSHLSNRTKHSNSYFGGVVIKGSLKMKIGERECELKEGGMIFVPPLTDWEANNISDSESIVYYWCGKFKT